jgi:hypothetical protein
VATGNFVPPTGALGLLDAVEIYAEATTWSTCARRTGGSVVCWGGGCYGDRPAWPASTPALTGATAIALSTNTVCRAAGPGAVACASPVECGGGFLTDPTPAPSGVNAMSGGWSHMCVSFGAGGVSCWGSNNFGQLGRSFTSGSASAPAPVVGLGATVALGVGGETSCAVSSTSAVRCWGLNSDWFVGIPSGAMTTPVLIVGL